MKITDFKVILLLIINLIVFIVVFLFVPFYFDLFKEFTYIGVLICFFMQLKNNVNNE